MTASSSTRTIVQVDEQDDRVSIVLSAATGVPTLSSDVVRELHAAVDRAVELDRPVGISSDGRAFCAGMDMSTLDHESDATLLQRFVDVELMLQAVRLAPVDTTSVLTGAAVGAGADLACAFRTRVGDDAASLRFPGLQFGILLGTGHLSRLVGRERAGEIVASGRKIGFDECLRLGLLHRLGQGGAESAGTTRGHDVAELFGRLSNSDADADLAALVRSASRPGLVQRFRSFRDISVADRR